jgi:biotin carboxyl carrier protein
MKARVNNKYDFILDENKIGFDIIEIKKGIFHIIKDNKSYNAEVLKANREEKTFIICVNGNKYTVQLKDKYDEMLEKLGMTSACGARIKEIKAPMPGLVVDVRVKEGDLVKQGDGLLVLQAMKMENVIKSPTEGSIKKVHIKKGDAIEKNQVMVSFA